MCLGFLIGLSTEWQRRYFYLVVTYACPGPNSVSRTFEASFARLQHTATGRFNPACTRHSGKWHEPFTGRKDQHPQNKPESRTLPG